MPTTIVSSHSTPHLQPNNNNTAVLNLSYGFTDRRTANNGNVVSLVSSATQIFMRSYTYDELNRLSTMSSPADASGCYGLSWTYDAWANRTNQTTTCGACTESHPIVGAIAANNQFTGTPYTYDATREHDSRCQPRLHVRRRKPAAGKWTAVQRQAMFMMQAASAFAKWQAGVNNGLRVRHIRQHRRRNTGLDMDDRVRLSGGATSGAEYSGAHRRFRSDNAIRPHRSPGLDARNHRHERRRNV